MVIYSDELKQLINYFSTKNIIIPAFIVFACLLLAVPSTAQTHANDCFEIKHLEFFGLEPDSKINWSDAELDKLVEMGENKQVVKTSILIAPLVFQLRTLHPDCSESVDKIRYDKLITVYFNIRRQDPSNFRAKTIADQLLFVREDFYAQLEDEKLLPHMRFTMDDGPLYGKIADANPQPVTGKSVETAFGKITIVNSKAGVAIVAFNKEKKVIWSRIMTDVYDKNLKSLDFVEDGVEVNSLVTIIHFKRSETLTLYLRPNGDFLYYFLSW